MPFRNAMVATANAPLRPGAGVLLAMRPREGGLPRADPFPPMRGPDAATAAKRGLSPPKRTAQERKAAGSVRLSTALQATPAFGVAFSVFGG